MSTPVQQGKVQSQLHGVSKHRYQRQKGQCTTRQPSWQWDSGPQTIGQTAINSRISTAKRPKHNYATKLAMGLWATKLSSKIITKRSLWVNPRLPGIGHTYKLQQITAKGKPVCQSRLSGNGHTRKLQSIIQTM